MATLLSLGQNKAEGHPWSALFPIESLPSGHDHTLALPFRSSIRRPKTECISIDKVLGLLLLCASQRDHTLAYLQFHSSVWQELPAFLPPKRQTHTSTQQANCTCYNPHLFPKVMIGMHSWKELRRPWRISTCPRQGITSLQLSRQMRIQANADSVPSVRPPCAACSMITADPKIKFSLT